MTTDIQTISSGKAIVSKNGKTTGRIYTFGGELSAKEIRQSYKDMGLSGRELTTKVNLALSKSAENRKAQLLIAVNGLGERGYLPNTMTMRNKTANISFIKAVDVESEIETTVKSNLLAKLMAKGMSEEEAKALLS